MEPLENDRWQGVHSNRAWEHRYTLEAWVDRFKSGVETWRRRSMPGKRYRSTCRWGRFW